jgi:sugar lactone lactonase YvrE
MKLDHAGVVLAAICIAPVALVAACSSSSAPPSTPVDSGTAADVSYPDTGTTPEASADAGSAKGTLWVTNNFAGTSPGVLGFSVASISAGGDVAPTTTIAGAKTTMTGPGCVAFDMSGNMWVVDSQGSKQQGQILEFSAADVATGGDVAPTTTVSGANTGLGNPSGCAFDSSGALWVTCIDPTGTTMPNLVAFSAAQLTTGGNVTPNVQFSGSAPNLCNSVNLTFDGAGDLWVSNLCSAIDEFGSSQLTGAGSAPMSSIAPPTGVNGLRFDSAGNLWTALQGGVQAVQEYPAAGLGDAGAASSVSISGTNSLMSNPFGLTFDGAGNLWVVQQMSNSLTMFDATGLATGGNVAPTAVVKGASTTLSSPSGITYH